MNYANFRRLSRSMQFFELAEDLKSNILEMRRYEKNYFLYRIEFNYEENVTFTNQLDLALNREEESFIETMGIKNFERFVQYVKDYAELMSNLHQRNCGPHGCDDLREKIRGTGQNLLLLADLEGCREIQCTMAETNILWVQERFEPDSDNFHHIIRVAQRWGAAVEMLRLVPQGNPGDEISFSADDFGPKESVAAYNGGVEDDEPDTAIDDGGIGRTQEELLTLGRFGGCHTVCGGYDKVLETVRGNGKYALVVIGNMFLSKVHSARTRQTREFALNIRDQLKAPLITVDEMKSRFLFGRRQALSLFVFFILVVLIYALVFTYQSPILNFLSGPIHQQVKWLAPLVLIIFIPFLAYLWGTAAELALKIIDID